VNLNALSMKLKLKKHKQTNEAQQLFIFFSQDIVMYGSLCIPEFLLQVVGYDSSFTPGDFCIDTSPFHFVLDVAWWLSYCAWWWLSYYACVPWCWYIVDINASFEKGKDIYRQLNCHLLLIWMPPTECIFIHSCIHVYIYMLILRVIWIIWMHCVFFHVYNKMATKINYTLDHHEFV